MIITLEIGGEAHLERIVFALDAKPVILLTSSAQSPDVRRGNGTQVTGGLLGRALSMGAKSSAHELPAMNALSRSSEPMLPTAPRQKSARPMPVSD